MDYRTVAARCDAEYTVKRSRFIASIAPVRAAEQAERFVALVSGEHPDARHHVFAWFLSDGGLRASDDGEPQGTAGMPVLDVLRHRAVVNVAAVVTRYFGGILLGAPGLVRAYSHAASLAVDAADIIVMRRFLIYEVRVSYARLGPLERIVGASGGRVINTDYAADVLLKASVPENGAEPFLSAVRDLTAGGVPEYIGETYGR